jgi:glycosyltransferase involved in cell wall biosynthesis
MSTHRVAMNLLWCVPGVGGSEEYLVRQLLGLAEITHDYEVHVFAPRGFSLRQPLVASAFAVHEAPSSCARRAQRIALEHTWLAWNTRGFHVVHHGGGSIPRVGNGRTLLTIHDVQWVDYPDYVAPIKLRYLRSMVPSSLRRAVRIAVPSHFVATTLVRAFGVNPDKVGVVRHGLETTFDGEATSEEALRRSLNLGDGPVLVYPAMTHPHKNHEFLLQLMATGGGAWADPALRLVCAGSAGSHETAVRARVRELGLTDRVVMPGRVSYADRNGLLAMADAMVFPSEYEGFGAPVIEAMRFGTPVICSDRASLSEVAGAAGLVCSLVADAWVKALDEVRLRHDELVAAGHQRAREFTAAISATELVTQYDVVIAATRGTQ